MTPNPPDEEFERRLRDVLRDRGLSIPPARDALARVHAGARRRQQRRTTISASAAVAVVVLAGGAIALRPHFLGTTPPGVTGTTTASTGTPDAAASAPSDFQPLSITAVGVYTYWVLGSSGCIAERCGAVLEQTTDAGITFKRLGRLSDGGALPPAPPENLHGDATSTMVRDVRFADLRNGWMYGGALYTTQDGGVTWTPDRSLAGNVVNIAAANGDVWAVVLDTTSGREEFGLYHAAYGAGGTSAWARVDLGGTLTASPDLAVIGKAAFLLDLPAASEEQTLVVTDGGAKYSKYAGACSPQSTGSLSVAGDGALWALCSNGHSTELFVSTDQAAHWQSANFSPLTYSLGGVDAGHAVVYDAVAGLDLVSIGASSPLSTPPNSGTVAGASFVGFTTTKIGFLIAHIQQAPDQLWRTTDGGSHWTKVNF